MEPADAPAAAWGDPPVVLRCGVSRPAALRRTSVCFLVNHVGWLATQDGRELRGDRPVDGTVSFTTIGRAAYVEVTVPDDGDRSSVAPLTDLAAAIRKTVPERRQCQ